MIYCEKPGTLHGPWLAAEGGRLVLRGHYEQGQPSGVLELFDEEGNVEKRVTYETPETGDSETSGGAKGRLPAEERP